MSKKAQPSKQEGMSKGKQIALLLLGVIGLPIVVLTLIFLPWIIPAVRHQILCAKAKEFLSEPAGRDGSGGLHIKGKVVLIDRRAKSVDLTQERLSDEIRAYSASEVGAVIWLDWDFEAVQGGRWGATTAHYSTCKLTVIDRARNVIVGEHTVMGASSPVSSGQGKIRTPPGGMTALRCTQEVAGYIKSLPRR